MKETYPEQTGDMEKILGVNDPGTGKRRLKRWVVLILVIAAAVFAGIKWLGAKNGAAIEYTTKPVEKGSLTITVTATGNLQPINQVDVGSELSGIIESVLVDYNERVTAGQVLATLDTSKLEAQVLKSRASLASARAKVLETEATIREAENDLGRLKDVRQRSGGKAVSEQNLDAAEATLARARSAKAVAEAAVSQAQADLDAVETDLSKAVIRSPVNGVVLVRSVEPGQTVAASLQAPVLFTLAENLTQMELHVDVDEADVGQVKAGQTADFTVDAYPDRRFPAQIKQVRYGSKTVAGVVTYETVLNVNNSDLSLRPGMTATADIIVQQIDDAVLIPNTALRFSPPSTEAASETQKGGSILQKLFPRRPRHEKKQNGNQESGNQKRVWKLEAGAPVPVFATTGPTNGIMTVVTAGDVVPGMELVVDSRSVE